MSANPRVADYAIHPQFTDRWSPRAFTGETIAEETLLSFFEAARASISGWHTHGMAGFDQELTRKELNIPEGYALHAAVAIGKLGDKATLAEYLQAREEPSTRRPLSELAAEGDFTL